MSNFKTNFKSFYQPNLFCDLCKNHEDDQDLIHVCDNIIDKEEVEIAMENLYSEDVKTEAARRICKVIQSRETL